MIFYEVSEERLGMREIPLTLAEMLRQVPRWCEAHHEEVEDRLFPDPTLDPDEEELVQDWRAHVQPELHELFLSSRQVVEADLHGMEECEGEFALDFPRKHVNAWLNALNQSRLALAAQHGFSEEEMNKPAQMILATERDIARLQIDFFAAIQEWLVGYVFENE